MRKNLEEILVLIAQLLVFYLLPVFAMEHHNSNGMIIIVILATFMLSLGIGGMSKNRIRYYYPIVITFLFIPAVYIYSTEFSMINTIYILISSFLGVLIGDFIMNK